MIRHLIAGIGALVCAAAIFYLVEVDKEIRPIQRVAAILEKTKKEVPVAKQVTIQAESKAPKEGESEEEKQLKSLKEKAGTTAVFKVSDKYKRNCSSCHGVGGEGIIGPKLIGQTKEQIRQKLLDYKNGVKQNYVMMGLLANMSSDDIEEYSQEISEFADRLKATGQ